MVISVSKIEYCKNAQMAVTPNIAKSMILSISVYGRVSQRNEMREAATRPIVTSKIGSTDTTGDEDCWKSLIVCKRKPKLATNADKAVSNRMAIAMLLRTNQIAPIATRSKITDKQSSTA